MMKIVLKLVGLTGVSESTRKELELIHGKDRKEEREDLEGKTGIALYKTMMKNNALLLAFVFLAIVMFGSGRIMAGDSSDRNSESLLFFAGMYLFSTLFVEVMIPVMVDMGYHEREFDRRTRELYLRIKVFAKRVEFHLGTSFLFMIFIAGSVDLSLQDFLYFFSKLFAVAFMVNSIVIGVFSLYRKYRPRTGTGLAARRMLISLFVTIPFVIFMLFSIELLVASNGPKAGDYLAGLPIIQGVFFLHTRASEALIDYSSPGDSLFFLLYCSIIYGAIEVVLHGLRKAATAAETAGTAARGGIRHSVHSRDFRDPVPLEDSSVAFRLFHCVFDREKVKGKKAKNREERMIRGFVFAKGAAAVFSLRDLVMLKNPKERISIMFDLFLFFIMLLFYMLAPFFWLMMVAMMMIPYFWGMNKHPFPLKDEETEFLRLIPERSENMVHVFMKRSVVNFAMRYSFMTFPLCIILSIPFRSPELGIRNDPNVELLITVLTIIPLYLLSALLLLFYYEIGMEFGSYGMAAKKRRSLTAEKRRSLTAEKRRSLTAEKRRSLTAEKKRSLIAEKKRSLTAEKKRSLIAEKKRSVAAEMSWGFLRFLVYLFMFIYTIVIIGKMSFILGSFILGWFFHACIGFALLLLVQGRIGRMIMRYLQINGFPDGSGQALPMPMKVTGKVSQSRNVEGMWKVKGTVNEDVREIIDWKDRLENLYRRTVRFSRCLTGGSAAAVLCVCSILMLAFLLHPADLEYPHGFFMENGFRDSDIPYDTAFFYSENTTIENSTVHFKRSVIISGCGVSFINSTVIFDNEKEGKYGLYVLDNGSLHLNGTSLDSASSFQFEVYGNLIVSNSQISNIWGDVYHPDYDGGIEIYSEPRSHTVRLSNSTITGCRTNGILADQTWVDIVNCTLHDIDDKAIVFHSSGGILENITIHDCRYGIYLKKSHPSIVNATIYHCKYGIDLYSSDPYIADSRIFDIGYHAIRKEYSDPIMENNYIVEPEGGIGRYIDVVSLHLLILLICMIGALPARYFFAVGDSRKPLSGDTDIKALIADRIVKVTVGDDRSDDASSGDDRSDDDCREACIDENRDSSWNEKVDHR